MSVYQFVPSPTFGISEHPFVTWKNGFLEDEFNEVIKYLSTLKTEKATIGGKNKDDNFTNIRESQVAWVSHTQESNLIYDRMAYIGRQLNGEFYKFDLYGFCEDFQYTVYQGNDSGHYSWHQDWNSANGSSPRKLTLVMQLSDPSEYEGGELQIMTSDEVTVVEKEKGLICAFPSFMLHRVTPVTKGIRKSLVVWITGPSFK